MISRRKALKTTLGTLGAATLLPHLSYSEKIPDVPVINDRAHFSPFYGEYIPDSRWLDKPLRARLNSNENPYGPSAAARNAIAEHARMGNLYGWQGIKDLANAIAKEENVAPDQVLIGPGSTDFLEKAGMLFFQNGGNLVSADPTFMTIIRTSQAVGADWKGIPLTDDWAHDLNAMASAVDNSTRMLYVCNPNNPTGTLTNDNALIDFGREISKKVPVFSDEAYREFLSPPTRSYTELIREGRNVLVARTFSKIHGLAGLRIGYLLGQKTTLERISRCSFTGMGIASTSVAAAMASLKDASFIDDCRQKNAAAREHTYNGLKQLGYSPVESFTSFMIFPITIPGPEFYDKMYEQGIGIRTLRINQKDWCRVSIGNIDSMDIFLEGLKKIG